MFSNSMGHNPQSEIHLNRTTCSLVGEGRTRTVQTLTSTPPHRVEHAGITNPTSLSCVPEKLLGRRAREMREKLPSGTVCKHPIWNHPQSPSPPPPCPWCTHCGPITGSKLQTSEMHAPAGQNLRNTALRGRSQSQETVRKSSKADRTTLWFSWWMRGW